MLTTKQDVGPLTVNVEPLGHIYIIIIMLQIWEELVEWNADKLITTHGNGFRMIIETFLTGFSSNPSDPNLLP